MVFNENDGPTWTLDIDGKKYTHPPKAAAPYSLTERTRVYSADRIKYPYKRVDWDPKGNRHPETRGKSQYERISWDEALDIVAGEIKRIRATYGPEASTAQSHSPHHYFGNIGYWFSTFLRFFMMLGHTLAVEAPISWEGWVWGAVHTYGYYWKLGRPEHNDLLEDALKNTELIVHWSNDPESTTHDVTIR